MLQRRCAFYPVSDFSRILNYFLIYRFKGLVSCLFFSHLLFRLTDRKGSVVLSGFINAARLSSSAAGTPLTDQRILFFGAGSAGIGVAKQLMSFFTLLGLSEEEAKSRIYVSNQNSLLIFVGVLTKPNSLDCRFQGIDYCR